MTIQTAFRLRPDLLEAVDELADERGVSRNRFVGEVLEREVRTTAAAKIIKSLEGEVCNVQQIK